MLNNINRYKLKCVSVDKSYLPIDVDEVRHYVNASFTDTDEMLKDIIIDSCQQVEIMTQKSILNRIWELTHARPDIILKMPPIKRIIAVFCKGPKKWHKIDLDNIEETFINDGERKINIITAKSDNKLFRVTYSAGATSFMKSHDCLVDNRYAIPYSVYQLILKLCATNYAKSRKISLESSFDLVSLCQNYHTGWNDPIF